MPPKKRSTATKPTRGRPRNIPRAAAPKALDPDEWVPAIGGDEVPERQRQLSTGSRVTVTSNDFRGADDSARTVVLLLEWLRAFGQPVTAISVGAVTVHLAPVPTTGLELPTRADSENLLKQYGGPLYDMLEPDGSGSADHDPAIT